MKKQPFYLIPVVATMFAGCSNSYQDAYTDKQSCLNDWAEEQCQESKIYDDNDNITGTEFIGPIYFPPVVNPTTGIITGGRPTLIGFHGNPTSLSTATAHIGAVRGGFGGIGAGHSVGG
jgi:hypothetical protein